MQPAKPFIFNKRGLTPNEFEDCLTSKVNELFKDSNTYEIKTLLTNCVTEVRKNVAPRENRISERLDKRFLRSLLDLVLNKLLSSNQATPTQDRQDTYGQQGTVKGDRRNIAKQHDEHYRLFSNFLIPKFRDVFHNITVKEETKGFFFREENNEKLTTEESCDVIDQITTKYIDYFFQLKENPVYPVHYHQKRKELQVEYESCLLVLMGRVAVDWSTENNLMDEKGYNDWKKHVLVVISYAALAVVLAMILSELDKCLRAIVHGIIAVIIGSIIILAPQFWFGVWSVYLFLLLLFWVMWVSYKTFRCKIDSRLFFSFALGVLVSCLLLIS
ncbi:uncharacterized protein LOC144630701 [Oculina patagonica]